MSKHSLCLSSILLSMTLLVGCASIVEGTDQQLMVQISPNEAVCQVSQKGIVIATVDNGGGQISVPKSKEMLLIECSAANHDKQMVSVDSSASGWGIVGCVLIDLCVTDYATGALNKYPNNVTVRLRKSDVAPQATVTGT